MTKDDFAALHRPGEPLILFNVWDAGSAKAVARAGARAIATGSLSLAGAKGYDDGEQISFDELIDVVGQISNTVSVPLAVDVETGFSDDVPSLSGNAQALLAAGAVGCNLEDRLLDAETLRETNEQCMRISVLSSGGLFVNARTDVFLSVLMEGGDPNSQELVEKAIERAGPYRDAGADCFFVPGLSDPAMIEQLCKKTDMPVNVMRLPGMVDNSALAGLGVSRISYGPAPWRDAMEQVESAARLVFSP